MRTRITRSLWLLLTPFVWMITIILGLLLIVLFLTILAPFKFPGFGFDHDPDPSGFGEDGPLEGRFHYGIV